jgi:aryl-alcohol dehydrogenase-like predicted oxidoreductase
MAAKRTALSFVGVTWTERQIRQHSAGALGHAMRLAGATQLDAAKWCRVSERTIREWLAERAPINLRAVLRSGRLRREFIRYLRVCDLKEVA